MPNLKCPVCGKEKDVKTLSIKIRDGKVYSPEAECECGGVMENTNPKSGVPGFRSNRMGQVY